MGHHQTPAMPQDALPIRREPPLLTVVASWQDCPTWSGRPISKWCRYGLWSEDGAELTVTLVL